ncbi:MAG: L-histidine N(alpha)-methyltransferase [Cyanobacteria bacterium M_DeepCast_100m_m1_067]|nr:L-histidine N(alpha)-methyltransferase [Cyanobacteria bacterium M_DeepCast_100m_m1_067]
MTVQSPHQLIDLHPAPADMARLVREGMAQRPRQLPAWLLYDAEGSRLFEAICEQPEYGLTRTETALLEERAPELAAALGPGVLVEFGAGNARKVGPLLEALRPPAYVALDISAAHLQQSCVALQARHPAVPVLGICCDYSKLQQLPEHPLLQGQRRLGFYPGSSIGNFSPEEAQALLQQMGQLLGPGARLLIGIDQPKAVARLEAAYNDAAGVSAAFARNLLVRLNRDLAGNFNPEAFAYTARWQPEHCRIAMALVSRQAQTVQLAGQTWSFAAGEPLITEYSVKYDPEAFTALAERAGWRGAGRWSDPAGDLSLHLLISAGSPVAADS